MRTFDDLLEYELGEEVQLFNAPRQNPRNCFEIGTKGKIIEFFEDGLMIETENGEQIRIYLPVVVCDRAVPDLRVSAGYRVDQRFVLFYLRDGAADRLCLYRECHLGLFQGCGPAGGDPVADRFLAHTGLLGAGDHERKSTADPEI